jgi:hypothetical protein
LSPEGDQIYNRYHLTAEKSEALAKPADYIAGIVDNVVALPQRSHARRPESLSRRS